MKGKRDMEEEQGTASTADAGTENNVATPVDPSVNAGREAFGNVSDFGMQVDDGDEAGASTSTDAHGDDVAASPETALSPDGTST